VVGESFGFILSKGSDWTFRNANSPASRTFSDAPAVGHNAYRIIRARRLRACPVADQPSEDGMNHPRA